MADITTKLVTQNGDTVILKEGSLPSASPSGKGIVKQGAGIAKDPDPERTADKKINTMLDSLRQSGVLVNDKFVLMYDKNYPQGAEEGGGIPTDRAVYAANQSATVKFEDSDEHAPYLQGYNFLGWSTNPSAVSPEYSYLAHEGGMDYTVTFTDGDITLYAIWEQKTVTVTYSLGEYGTGSVPSSVTTAEGNEVIISDSPAPTVNDGSGRVFVGWATEDGYSSYESANYKAGDSIYPYEDITLYPVFCAQYTLSYSLGNDATGTVPSVQTAYDGQTLSINFNPSLTCISDGTKVFVGWSETDEDTTATYTANGTNSIYMNGNITLYPVFAAQGGGDADTLSIDATGSSTDITIVHEDEDIGETVIDKTISAGVFDTFTFNAGIDYRIEFGATSEARIVSFTGSYDGIGYTDEILTVGDEFNANVIMSPDGNSVWSGFLNISGTLTCTTSSM